MCGIVGYIGEKEAAPILLDGLKKLEYRGYDSAGIAVLDNNVISVSKTTGRIKNLDDKTAGGKIYHGHAGIGHTRWATHGAPTDANAHPHMSNDGKFAVVHNGIIENYLELRRELTEKGYIFNSETDTEVVAHLISMYYEGDLKAALIKTSEKLIGSYALGVMYSDDMSRVYVAKQASPLIIGIGENENYFASDVTALVSYTRNALYLDDGEFAEITPVSVTVFDKHGNCIDKKAEKITWDIQSAEKCGYEHFMLKEIYEQPKAIYDTLKTRVKGNDIVLDGFDVSREYLCGIDKIVITACGSAYYAGCAGKYAIEKLCRIPVLVELASELRYSDPIIDEKTLLIVLSQSGETADTIAAMRECKNRGAKTLAIVNVVGSTIAKTADNVIYTWAGPEIAVATTKGYTTQLSVLYLFSLYAARKMGRVCEDEYLRLLSTVNSLPEKINNAIELSDNIKNIAKKYKNAHSIFFIGRNTDYAVALEGALKLKEISYIHAECYAAGELKHGTIALIDKDQGVVALSSNDSIMEKTLSNIVEVKARGADVLSLTYEGNERVCAVSDNVIYIPKVEPIFSAAVEVIPLQLLAYYTAKEKGCDIDKPKNLAKSVTVE